MTEHPPCPRCSFPYEPGAAERYWEARWRDEKAENERLRSRLDQVEADRESYKEQMIRAQLALHDALHPSPNGRVTLKISDLPPLPPSQRGGTENAQ